MATQWNMGKVSERVKSVNTTEGSICICFLTRGEMACGYEDVLAEPHHGNILLNY